MSTKLLNEIELGNLDEVRESLQCVKYEIDSTDSMGNTLLHHACTYGRLDMVRMFICEFKANVNIFNGYKNMPLHVAALNAKEDVTLALIDEFNCSTDIKGQFGMSILHCACVGGSVSLVQTLICKHKADINAKNDNGDTALNTAALFGNEEVTLALINEFGCDINIKGQFGRLISHNACLGGNENLIKTLIHKYKVDIMVRDDNNDTPLHLAAFSGKEKVALTLINEFGCSANVKGKFGRSVLHDACEGGNVNLVCALIQDHKANVKERDDNSDTPLNIAALTGNEDVALTLIDKYGCDINVKGRYGRSVLHNACQGGNISLVRTLIRDHKADVKARDDNHNTPLNIAAFTGNEKLALALINEFDCDNGVQGQFGRSILHQACYSQNYVLVQFLVQELKMSVNSIDEHGNTPLHYCSFLGAKKCAEILLMANASPLFRNNYGKSPIHSARGELKALFVQHLQSAQNDKQQKSAEENDGQQKFLIKVKDAIAKNGKINRKLANIMFVGPTGSGKSSLMNRLLGKLKKTFSASTGVCSDIVVVDIDIPNPATYQVATIVEGMWREIECEASFVGQLGQESIFSTSEPEEHEAVYTVISKPNQEAEVHQPLQVQTVIKSKHDANSPEKLPFHRSAPSQEVPKVKSWSAISRDAIKSTPIHSTIQSIIKKHGFETFKKYLEKTSSLYLRDTGGQVEFQEMLGLLTFGPSIFFFVFRADLDFKSKYEVKYRKSADESINCYTSSITTEEALLQSLASVYAMDASSEDIVKTHQPLVFIVGTHVDKLGSEKEVKLSSLNQHLESSITKNGFSHLVEYSDRQKGHIMFAVDNTSENDDSFQLIRTRVNSLVIERKMFNIEYPISYLLFCLDLQNIKKSILSFEECCELATSHGITRDQVPHLLQFLQIRIGLIRYFEVEGLPHIIVKEPQVLFNSATNLIIKTYNSNFLTNAEAHNLEKKGIISLSVIENLVDEISPEVFVKLLVHLRIAVPFSVPGENEEKYFFPCVLNHVSESTKEDPETNVLPLAIKFKCNHCPKGIFGVLVSHLMRPERDDHSGAFTLLGDKIFKDQVSFEIDSAGVLDKISLRIFSSYIEVKFFPEHSEFRKASVNIVCDSIRQTLENSLCRALEDLHYKKDKVEPKMCFRCQCSELHPVEKEKDIHLLKCRNSNKTSRIPPSGRCWYNEEDDNFSSQSSVSSLDTPNGNDNKQSSSSQSSVSSLPNTPLLLNEATSIRTDYLTGIRKPLKLSTLLKELMPLASEWHNIGTLLDISEEELDTIEKDNQGSKNCLREMIKAWLKMVDPEPTWDRLVEAVDVIDQKRAQYLKSEHTNSLIGRSQEPRKRHLSPEVTSSCSKRRSVQNSPEKEVKEKPGRLN